MDGRKWLWLCIVLGAPLAHAQIKWQQESAPAPQPPPAKQAPGKQQAQPVQQPQGKQQPPAKQQAAAKPAPAKKAGPPPEEVVKKIASEVTKKAGMAVAAPSYFPDLSRSRLIHATVLTAEKGEYEINLGHEAGCTGASGCTYGHLAGKAGAAETPSGTRSFPFPEKGAKPVDLAQGVKGYFVDPQCKPTCGDARLYWVQGGNQYMIGLKAGTRQDTVQMANSVIEKGKGK